MRACVVPYLELQCVEGLVGRAADWALGLQLQGVQQPVALGPQGTAQLQAGLADAAGSVVHQLEPQPEGGPGLRDCRLGGTVSTECCLLNALGS